MLQPTLQDCDSYKPPDDQNRLGAAYVLPSTQNIPGCTKRAAILIPVLSSRKKIHVSFPRIRMSLNPSLQAGFHQILVTQPRRIAAISLARRVSCEQMDAKSRVVGQLGEQPKVLCFRRMCGKVWKINDFCT